MAAVTSAESTSSSSSSSSSSASSSSSSTSSSSSSLSSLEVTLTSADYYFDSNSHYGVHEELLKDKVRMNAWKKAIFLNKHLFADKVVLEIGTGTGIFSMMAAKAGAKHVYSLESGGIYHQACKIIKKNGLDHVVTIFNSSVSSTVLPVEKVDIIMCDWIGYALFYDSMVEQLIEARDKWLAPNGLIFPDRATLNLVAIEDGEYRSQKIDFWDDVYGFRMGVLKNDALCEPLIDSCKEEQLISAQSTVFSCDLSTATIDSLRHHEGRFEMEHQAESGDEWCHAFVLYFTVTFGVTHSQIRFSTSPRAEWTHWKQTVFYLPKPFKFKVGQKVEGTFAFTRGKSSKEMDFEIAVKNETNPLLNQSKQYKLR